MWHGNCNTPSVMKLAIPYWEGRLSPVLDFAGHLVLVDVAEGKETSRQRMPIAESTPLVRAKRIKESEVDVVICGAVSWPLERALESAGIEVIAQIRGDVDEVIEAYLAGHLPQERFLMPGCHGIGRRRRKGRRQSRRSP